MRRFSFEYEQYADLEEGGTGELERQVMHVDSETVTLSDVVEKFVLFLQAVGYPVASVDVALDTEALDGSAEDEDGSDE